MEDRGNVWKKLFENIILAIPSLNTAHNQFYFQNVLYFSASLEKCASHNIFIYFFTLKINPELDFVHNDLTGF